MTLLAEILSSRVRAEIFRLLFGVNPSELYMREIERLSGFSIGTIQTELKKLTRLDLVAKRRDGNRLYYAANKTHPLYPDIRNIVLKTSGLTDVFKEALSQTKSIEIAFIFGSIANHSESAASDIDLMVLGDITLRQLSKLLGNISEKMGREVNPHVLTVDEFRKRYNKQDPFLSRILLSPKFFIVGDQSDLEAVV